MGWTMTAAGTRSALLNAGGTGLALAVVSDAMWVRTVSDAAHVGSLVGAQADVTRLRLGLEGSWAFSLPGEGGLTPKAEVGLRHDGGDAETGMGVEVGGGIDWRVPSLGLTLDLSGRTLLAHENEDFQDAGFSIGAMFDPNAESERGLSVTLRRDFGTASGGMQNLFSPEIPGTRMGAMGAMWMTDVAWGLPAFRDRFTGSPTTGFGFSDTSRDYSIGWRLAADAPTAPNLSLDLKATRRESEGMDPDHGVTLDFNFNR